MPKIVQDLADRIITRVGPVPEAGGAGAASIFGEMSMSQGQKLYRGYVDLDITTSSETRQSGLKLNMRKANERGLGNGRYIREQRNRSVFAPIDSNHTIVISGRYGGCAYKVYRLRYGQIICAHIYRGGQNPEELVNVLTEFADRRGWTELHHISTDGETTRGCTRVLTVTEKTGTAVLSILVKVGEGNRIVATGQIKASFL